MQARSVVHFFSLGSAVLNKFDTTVCKTKKEHVRRSGPICLPAGLSAESVPHGSLPAKAAAAFLVPCASALAAVKASGTQEALWGHLSAAWDEATLRRAAKAVTDSEEAGDAASDDSDSEERERASRAQRARRAKPHGRESEFLCLSAASQVICSRMRRSAFTQTRPDAVPVP